MEIEGAVTGNAEIAAEEIIIERISTFGPIMISEFSVINRITKGIFICNGKRTAFLGEKAV